MSETEAGVDWGRRIGAESESHQITSAEEVVGRRLVDNWLWGCGGKTEAEQVSTESAVVGRRGLDWFRATDVESEDVERIVADRCWFLGRRRGLEADSHIEDVSLRGGRLRWLWVSLHRWNINNVENVIIHYVLWRFFLFGLSGLFDLGLFGLSLFWLSGGGDSNFPMLLGLLMFGDVVIVVDGTGAGHFYGFDIEVHVCFSDGDVLEGLDGGLEGGDCDANLFLSVGVPTAFEQLGILAGSLLDL